MSVARIVLGSYDVLTSKALSRTFSYVNRDYIANISAVGDGMTPPEPIQPVVLPTGYTSLWHWLNEIGRGLNSLTTMTYVDVAYSLDYQVSEELNA